jgi:hypothetical protein
MMTIDQLKHQCLLDKQSHSAQMRGMIVHARFIEFDTSRGRRWRVSFQIQNRHGVWICPNSQEGAEAALAAAAELDLPAWMPCPVHVRTRWIEVNRESGERTEHEIERTIVP